MTAIGCAARRRRPLALPWSFGLLLPSFILALLCACVVNDQLDEQGSEAGGSAAVLERAIEDYVEYIIEPAVSRRIALGLPIAALPDRSAAKLERDADFATELLARLEGVDPDDLNHDQLLSLEILRWLARDLRGRAAFYWLTFDVIPSSSLLRTVTRVFSSRSFSEPDELDRYLRLLNEVPGLVRGVEQKTRDQAERGILVPRGAIDQAVPFVLSMVGEGEESPFYVTSERLAAIDAGVAETFVEELGSVIEAQINPALRSLAETLEGDYRDRAPDAIGLWQYPGGEEYYRYLVRHYTTLDMSPEEVHRIGLEQVEQIDRVMAQVRDSVGFEGSKEEFHRFLKTDPRFFPKSPEEIEERHLAYAAEMDEKVDSLFLRRPQAPYGVKRLDPHLEASSTFGSYQRPTAADPVGYYRFNGSKLEERSLLYNQPLTLHELIPGHHFQINLQMENETLPEFRRHSHYSAYSEGWGEYGTFLGLEAGLVDDPYDLYGLHIFDMYGSVRLVVDTGLNHYRWSRERAMQYMREHLTDSETQIQTESLRYGVRSPGQAVSYKIGMLRWVELRQRAEEALGEDFDIRRFHDTMLRYGAMPMSVLAQHVDWFVEEERTAAGN